MNRTGWILLVLLVIAVSCGFGYWFFTHFEKVKKEVEIGFSGEAARNHLLAAQHFFEAYGISINSVEGIARLPEQKTTIILPTERLQLGVDESKKYLQWIENGGHLVVAATHGYYHEEARQDPLLDLVGINTVATQFDTEANEDDPSDEDEDTFNPAAGHGRCTDNLVDVDWPGLANFLTITMNDRARLRLDKTDYPVALKLTDEYGTFLLRLKIGKGYLTVLYSAGFMGNALIAENDNAIFFWHVAQVDEQHPIWLVFNDAMPSLWSWLLRNAWSALLSFGLFLLIWLWYASRRFGPLLPAQATARRRLLEHIEAAGRFLWKRGHAQRLYKAVHHGLMRTVELRHPVWLSLSVDKLRQRLAEISGLPIKQVEQALADTQARNEHEFTKSIQTLEHIRKSL